MLIRVKVSLLMAVTLGLICTGCSSDPGWPRGRSWKTGVLNDTVKGDFDAAWAKTANTIARDYDIEVFEKDRGYIKTGWKYGIIRGAPYNHSRGRITIRYTTTESPSEVEVKTDVQVLSDLDHNVWMESFDRSFDHDVYTNLSDFLRGLLP